MSKINTYWKVRPSFEHREAHAKNSEIAVKEFAFIWEQNGVLRGCNFTVRSASDMKHTPLSPEQAKLVMEGYTRSGSLIQIMDKIGYLAEWQQARMFKIVLINSNQIS